MVAEQTITDNTYTPLVNDEGVVTDLQKKYPIAETFLSPQGEGRWAGHLMYFIRFAGCSVGKPFTKEERAENDMKGLPVIQPYQEKCTTWANESFVCDTNYRMSMKLSVQDIVDFVGNRANRICLTGGEPLIHDLKPLIYALSWARKHVHIETSGTIEFPSELFSDKNIWITVSPKYGCLDRSLFEADEIKVLVGDDFDEKKFVEKFSKYFDIRGPLFYIQPINDEHTIRQENVKKCLDLQKRYPNLAISIQAHKTIGVR